MGRPEHRRSRRKALCGLALIALALPPILLAALNLALGTPWVCHRLAAQLQARTHLESSIDRISIWPWSGITVSGIKLSLPGEATGELSTEPLFQAKSVRVIPHWNELARKKLRLRDITIDQPRVTLPLEMLVALMPPPPAPTTPMVAQHQAQPAGPSIGIQNLPGTPAPVRPQLPAAPLAATPATPPPTTAPPATVATPEPPPTLWCHIHDGALTIRSKTAKVQVTARDISGDIPLAGKKAASTIRVGEILLGNQQLGENWNIPLAGASRRLQIGPVSSELGGLHFEWLALMLVQQGAPLEIHARAPEQPLNTTTLANATKASIGHLIAQADFAGFLMLPRSWRGHFQALASDVHLAAHEHDSRFADGSCQAWLQSGQLICPDFRLTGDDASLLGNARLQADGRYAATVRLVAEPDHARALAKRLFPGVEAPIPLTPLSTPQRAAFDLEAFGDLQHLSLQLGHNGPIVTINPKSTTE